MQTGIIGLPQVGKTSLFRILTHLHLDAKAAHAPTHIGVARVPDARLERLAELYKPRKVTHATIGYVDVGGLMKDRAKDSAFLTQLREVDALAHVVRVFENSVVPHVSGTLDPLRDVEGLELELMLADLEQATRRIERVEKDLKKKKEPALEHELALLQRCRAAIEAERPLREVEFGPDEQKLLSSFMFLSQKPMLYVLNLGDDEVGEIDGAIQRHNLGALARKSGTAVVPVCGRIEAELAELEGAEAAELLAAYGLKESGLARLVHATYGVLGLISFFTCAEAECRAWAIRRGTTAVKAAGVVHSDFERGFIKAEVVRWSDLLEAGSLVAARERGRVKLEGKEYVVEEGDVILFRHSG
jgi:GTP-binding protein YchF